MRLDLLHFRLHIYSYSSFVKYDDFFSYKKYLFNYQGVYKFIKYDFFYKIKHLPPATFTRNNQLNYQNKKINSLFNI